MSDKTYGGLTIWWNDGLEYIVFFEREKYDPDAVKLGTVAYDPKAEKQWHARSERGPWTYLDTKWEAAEWLLFVWNDRRNEHRGEPQLVQKGGV